MKIRAIDDGLEGLAVRELTARDVPSFPCHLSFSRTWNIDGQLRLGPLSYILYSI